MILPEICIRQSKHLNAIAAKIHETSFTNRDISFIENRIKEYQVVWRSKEIFILKTLQQVSHLRFIHSFIVAYVTRYLHTISDPLIISAHFSPEEFVDVFIHELIHILLVYNQENYSIRELLNSQLFSKYSNITRIHILVFAIQACLTEKMHQDPFKFLITGKSNESNDLEYKLAYDIVYKIGFKKITKLLYHDITKSLTRNG